MKRLTALILVFVVLTLCIIQNECLAAGKKKAESKKGQAKEKEGDKDEIELKACPLAFTGTFLKVVGKDNYYVNPDASSNLNGRTLLTLILKPKDIKDCPSRSESDPEEWIDKKVTIKGIFNFTTKSKNTQLKFVGDMILESITLVEDGNSKK